MSEKSRNLASRVEDVVRRYIKAYGLKPNAVSLGHEEWHEFERMAGDHANHIASIGVVEGQFCRLFDMAVLPVSCDEYLAVGRIEPE